MKTNKIQCNKCKNQIDSYDYVHNNGVCDSCKNKKALVFGFVLFSIVLLIALPISLINYNYALDKCDNLNSKESNYDFSETVELNGQYNSSCYYLNNHPLALPGYIFTALFMSLLITILGHMVKFIFTPHRGSYI